MTPAQERRILLRSSDPLTAAALKILALKRALFKANDRGVQDETRASGECRCSVCDDMFRDHPQTAPESCPTAVGICTGERFKL